MSRSMQFGVMAFFAVACLLLAPLAVAQQDQQPPQRGQRGDAPGGGGPGGPGGFGGNRGPGGPGGGNFDPAQLRERMMEGLKERLECTDDEWVAVGPLVSKVMDAQAAGRGGFGGFGGRGGDRGGRGGGDNAAASTDPVSKARDALRDAVDNNGDVEGKLKSYREALAKQAEELKKAQEELRAVLTMKQEATLVLSGMLE